MAKKLKNKEDVKKVGEKNKGKSKEEKEGLRGIVRIADTDLNGHLTIDRALTKIKGIDKRLAKTIALIFSEKTKFDLNKKLGEMPPEFDEKLEEIIKKPLEFGVPEWMLNRRKDYVSGKHLHLLNADLDFALREDVQRLSRIRARRGLRLLVGLPVRGQRTKSNWRRGGRIVGVVRNK